MFDLPPDPPAFDTDPIIEALVECGLQRGGLKVTYDDLLQETVVTISESAGASAEHFGCIRGSLQSYVALDFKAEELGEDYWEFVAEQERPRRLAESGRRLAELALLEGFPRRDRFTNFADYLRALERHAGLVEGEWLSADGEIITFQPPEVSAGQDATEHYERSARILTLIHYASLLGDLPHFGFFGNERAAED